MPASPLASRSQAICAVRSAQQPPQRQRRRAAATAAALPSPATAAALADVLLSAGELQPWVLPAAGLGVAAAG